MDEKGIIKSFWRAALSQDAAALSEYFAPAAVVKWHNTNEQFTAEEFIRANCEYPGVWQGEVERLEQLGDLLVSVTRVWPTDKIAFFHATSFFRLCDGKILELNEYWGDDGPAPEWRRDKKIGVPIKE